MEPPGDPLLNLKIFVDDHALVCQAAPMVSAVGEEIDVAAGWTIPFFPMRPASGPRLTKRVALKILEEQESHRYIYQPKLNGDRVLLAVHNRQIIACNRQYGWYKFQIHNAASFLGLRDGTLFDGEVWQGSFYPFDLLALEGRSYKANTADERQVMAMQMCRLLKVEWLFSKPTKKWLLNLDSNMPKFEGVVRKLADQGYYILANSSATSMGWLKYKF